MLEGILGLGGYTVEYLSAALVVAPNDRQVVSIFPPFADWLSSCAAFALCLGHSFHKYRVYRQQ